MTHQITACLRCKNKNLVIFRQEDFPGMVHGQARNAVCCDKCGILYDDWGKDNRVCIMRIIPKNVCSACGGKLAGVLNVKRCEYCEFNRYTDEFVWFAIGTRGWVKGLEKGKFSWKDDGKLFLKLKRDKAGRAIL